MSNETTWQVTTVAYSYDYAPLSGPVEAGQTVKTTDGNEYNVVSINDDIGLFVGLDINSKKSRFVEISDAIELGAVASRTVETHEEPASSSGSASCI